MNALSGVRAGTGPAPTSAVCLTHTDSCRTYNIALIEDYTFGDDFETYMLNVLPHSMEEYDKVRREHSVKVRKDDKIKQTVLAVLEEAMRNQNRCPRFS